MIKVSRVKEKSKICCIHSSHIKGKDTHNIPICLFHFIDNPSKS